MSTRLKVVDPAHLLNARLAEHIKERIWISGQRLDDRQFSAIVRRKPRGQFISFGQDPLQSADGRRKLPRQQPVANAHRDHNRIAAIDFDILQ